MSSPNCDRLVATAVFVALFGNAIPCAAARWSVTSLSSVSNRLVLDTSTSPVGGLSGLTYLGTSLPGNGSFLAIEDSGGALVKIDVVFAADGSLLSAAAVERTNLPTGLDGESIAPAPNGTVFYVGNEADFDVVAFSMPGAAAAQSPSAPPLFAHTRSNRGFEAMTSSIVPGETDFRLLIANEEALDIDGPLADVDNGTTVRLQLFQGAAAGAIAPSAADQPQYAYQVDPIHAGTTTNAQTRSGLVELVAMPDGSTLALERSLSATLAPYQNRLYEIDWNGATDVSGAPLDAGLALQSFTPVGKNLLWSGPAGGGFGQNMEGLALGPRLSATDWLLIGVVDNGKGSDPLSDNTILWSIAHIDATLGDLDLDGDQDGRDFLNWQRAFGAPLWGDDFANWEGAWGNALASAPIPEPLSSTLVAIGCAPFLPRGRRT